VRTIRCRLILLTVLACVVGSAGCARGELLTLWTFGPDSTNYQTTPDYDATGSASLTALGESGKYDIDGGNGTPFTDAAGTAHDAGQALHWSDCSSSVQDAVIQASFNLTNWKDVAMRWDYKSDTSGGKQGPVRYDFDYSLDSGDNWVSVVNNGALTRDDTWHAISLTLPTEVNGQTNVMLRWDDLKEDATKDGDYWQDNIQLTGTLIPEPCAATLMLAGLSSVVAWLGLCRRQRGGCVAWVVPQAKRG